AQSAPRGRLSRRRMVRSRATAGRRRAHALMSPRIEEPLTGTDEHYYSIQWQNAEVAFAVGRRRFPHQSISLKTKGGTPARAHASAWSKVRISVHQCSSVVHQERS